MPKETAKERRQRRERERLADPTTYAALDGAKAEADAKYGARLKALFSDMQTALAAGEQVQAMKLHAEFNALSIEQKHFAEAVLQRRLNDEGDGSELVDA